MKYLFQSVDEVEEWVGLFLLNCKKWEEAIGVAKFVGESDVAMLKVSFFRPFYGGYNVIALDNDYKYALVCGNDLSYL